MSRHTLHLMLLFLMTFCYGAASVCAQEYTWAQLVDDYVLLAAESYDDGEDSEMRIAWLEELEEFHRHPIPINTATREDLMALGFLSDAQVDSLLARRDRYSGGLRSVGELLTVPELMYRERQWLSLLLSFEPAPSDGQSGQTNTTIDDGHAPQRLALPWKPSADPWRDGRHELMATGAVPLYRKGGFTDWTDDNQVTRRFLGSNVGHTLRYRYNWRSRTMYGATVQQDVGEPFARHGALPWDFGAAYFYYRSTPRGGGRQAWSRYEVAAGDYRLTIGQGLVMGGDTWSRGGALLGGTRSATTRLRPHTGTDESRFLRGGAATLRWGSGRQWALTAWASWRRLDASVKGATAANGYDPTALDTVTSWKTDGLHRTLQETLRRHTVQQMMGGARIGYDGRHVHVGATALHVAYDRVYWPALRTYNHYVMRGRSASAASVDYTLQWRRWSVQGEIALDASAAYAVTTALRFQPTRRWSLVVQERSLGRDFVSPYGRPMQAGSGAQNEHGALLGVRYYGHRSLVVTAYGDWAYHPDPVYLADTASHRLEASVEATWRGARNWNYTLRYRLKGREQNVTGYKDLADLDGVLMAWRTTQHLRGQASGARGPWRWTFGTDVAYYHAQATHISSDWELTVPTSLGALVYGRTAWHPLPQLSLQAATAFFVTDSYDARCYAYMPQLSGQSVMTSACSGRGTQGALTAEWQPRNGLYLSARFATICYFDRDVISSGVNLIPHPSRNDLTFQVRWVI